MSKTSWAGVALACFLFRAGAGHAAEGATGVYLLGMKNPGAATTPAEGVYYQNDLYFYDGKLGGNRPLPTGGAVVADVKARAEVNLSTFLWSTPWQLAGGRVSLTATVPLGEKHVDAGVELSGPRIGAVGTSQSDSLFTVGDPSLGAAIGWQAGTLSWQTGVSFNVPIGDYHKDRIANVAFHRWGTDVTGSMTWFDPSVGLDVSGTLGYTLNDANDTTHYGTGNELHLDASISQYVSRRFSLGLLGYYYRQVSADSGSGAVLGPFKGRVAALGATASYAFRVGKRVVTTRIKYFHETAVTNRARGNSAFLTFVVPLSTRR